MTTIAAPAGTSSRLFGRKALLVMTEFSNPAFVGDLEATNFDRQGIDLSKMHFRFETQQQDDQTPNTCSVRVYNLSDVTVRRLIDRFDGMILQAGYQNGPYGTVFAGAVRQFRVGRENNVDSYLDILATDGDVGYNFGVVAQTVAGGTNMRDVINRTAAAMNLPVKKIPFELGPGQNYIRGKVMWGMGRNVLRDIARSLDASWSIVNGQVQFTPLNGYQPGEAVVINSKTGMIGIPELTNDGVSCRCLMNPKIKVGGLIKINNNEINRTIQQNPKDLRQFNAWNDINHLAKLNADGTYQAFVVEHQGDTRDQAWYTDLTCLSVDLSSKTVKPYG